MQRINEISQRNYRAFQYLLKKKPKEYRGEWKKDIYVGYHIYEPLVPGLQLARLKSLFVVRSYEIQEP